MNESANPSFDRGSPTSNFFNNYAAPAAIQTPEDYANTFIGFDGAQLVRRPQQPAFDLVFVYDAVDGTLELWAQGGADLRQDLQAIFGETILHEKIGPETKNSIPYDIGDLKKRDFKFPLLPTDGIASVKVRSLRLSTKGNRRRRITIEGDVRSNPQDVYDLMATALHEQRLPLANVDVEHAGIQVEMQSVNGERAKRFSFGISPNSCSLKEKPEHLAVTACFKRWNIARA